MAELNLGIISIQGTEYVAVLHLTKDQKVTKAMKAAVESYKKSLQEVCSGMTPFERELPITDETIRSHGSAAETAWKRLMTMVEAPSLAGQFAQNKAVSGEKVEIPFDQKLKGIKPLEGCLKTAGKDGVIGDLSLGMRRISSGLQDIPNSVVQFPVGGMPLVGLTGAVGIGAGIATAYDKYKEWNHAKVIGDTRGQAMAAVEGLHGGLDSLGSTVLLSDNLMEAVQQIQMALHQPIAITGAATVAQNVLTLGSSFAAMVSLTLMIGRHIHTLVSLVQGAAWRGEILAAEDPIQALEEEKMRRIRELDITEEVALKAAKEAGARWLSKVEKEGGFKIQDKEGAFEKLIERHPRLIEGLIGASEVPLTTKGELIRFGNHMARLNAEATFEADCVRKLGADVVQAMKSSDTEALKKALDSHIVAKLSLKIAAAAIGLVAIVILTMALTGSPMGILIILAGIGALAMIVACDWETLKNHLTGGEFKKRDKAFVYFTLALSVLSFAGIVALTVASGGVAPFIASLIFSAAWVGINSYSVFLLRKFEQRPWDVKKSIDRATYIKFLETQPIDRARLDEKLQEKRWADMTFDQIKAEEGEEQKRLQEQLNWLKTQLN